MTPELCEECAAFKFNFKFHKILFTTSCDVFLTLFTLKYVGGFPCTTREENKKLCKKMNFTQWIFDCDWNISVCLRRFDSPLHMTCDVIKYAESPKLYKLLVQVYWFKNKNICSMVECWTVKSSMPRNSFAWWILSKIYGSDENVFGMK